MAKNLSKNEDLGWGQLNFHEGGSFSGQKDFKPEFSAKPILKQRRNI